MKMNDIANANIDIMKQKKKKSKASIMASTSTSLCKESVSDNWKHFCSSVGRPVQLKAVGTVAEIHTPRFHPKQRGKASKVVALDCEMVADKDGKDMLARVSVVDFSLACILDVYVKPTAEVFDYRTRFSGIRPKDIENGEDFKTVQLKVKNLLRDKILVGHSLRNDLNAIGFGHHVKLIRDTSYFKTFRDISNGKTPSLKKLAQHFLGETIQSGEHSSVEDAAAAMKLYKKFRHDWEKSL